MAEADMREVVTVGEADAGQRLDRFLASRLPALSRSRLQALMRAGAVAKAGTAQRELGVRVRIGETYEVRVPAPEPAKPAPEAIALTIVYEDAHLIVIDKPKGLAVHPGPGHAKGTLVNALIAHCGESLSGIGGVKRPGIVHRLDKDTTGLMVVAKTDSAHQGLAQQFAAHGADGRLERSYRAVVWGVPDRPRGIIDAPLARSAANRTKIAVVAAERAGRRAVTRYQVLQTFAAGGTEPAREPARPRARNRPHAPGARAPRPHRPSAARRHDLRRRLQGERAQAAAASTGGAGRARPAGPARRRAHVRAPGDGAAARVREPAAGRHGGARCGPRGALNCGARGKQ